MKLSITHLLYMVGLAIPLSGPTTSTEAADVRPHIVYILADDLGWKDEGVSCRRYKELSVFFSSV